MSTVEEAEKAVDMFNRYVSFLYILLCCFLNEIYSCIFSSVEIALRNNMK